MIYLLECTTRALIIVGLIPALIWFVKEDIKLAIDLYQLYK